MSESIVVVESERKAQTIRAQIGAEVKVVALDPPLVEAVYQPPADPRQRDSLNFKFVLRPGASLRWLEEADQSCEILLAFADDPRGEYCSWLLAGYVRQYAGGRRSVQRLRPWGLDGKHLKAALAQPDLIDDARALAWAVRGMFDSCFNRHCNRLLGTTVGPGKLPLHMDELLPVFLLQQREEELRGGGSTSHWRIRVQARVAEGEFDLILEEAYGLTDEGIFKESAQVKRALEMVRGQELRVLSLKRKPQKLEAVGPYRLPALLAAAHAARGFSPKQAFQAVIELFEGVSLEGKSRGLLGFYLPTATGGGELLPLDMGLTPEQVASELTPDQAVVYALVYQRAQRAQRGEERGEEIEVEVEAGEHAILRARALCPVGEVAPGVEDAHKAGVVLGGLSKGRVLEVLRVVPEQQVAGEEGYTLDDFADELADFSRPFDGGVVSSFEAMIRGGYCNLSSDGALRAGESCGKLVRVLGRALPAMPGISLAAYYEQTVAEVLSGRKVLRFALQQFDQTLMMQGNVLVKFKPSAITPRPGRAQSRSIIKSKSGGESEEGTQAKERTPPVQETVESGEPPDPVDVTEPTGPVGSEEPVEPVEPVESVEPVEPVAPVALVEPVEPEKQEEPEESEEREGSENLAEREPVDSVEAVESVEPDETCEADGADEAGQADDFGGDDESGDTVGSADIVKPTEGVKPEPPEPPEPVEPVGPPVDVAPQAAPGGEGQDGPRSMPPAGDHAPPLSTPGAEEENGEDAPARKKIRVRRVKGATNAEGKRRVVRVVRRKK